jgi:hypothetical protein
MRKLADSGDPAADNLFGHFEVIGRLQVDLAKMYKLFVMIVKPKTSIRKSGLA